MTSRTLSHTAPIRLGLRENAAQFALLVVVNAFVGAMAGIERSILPLMAEREFGLAVRASVLSFIVVFGLSKALTNYAAGRLAERHGRKRVLIAGWLIATPVPFLLMWAPTWTWILVANVLLGVSQGLTWSATVIMKIDLVGHERRGLAMGLNEAAGYMAVALAAAATGWIAAEYGLRPQPFYLGVVFVAVGLALSAVIVRDTSSHVALETQVSDRNAEPPRDVFWRTTLGDRNLSTVSQAGLVNNLNDGMAWGLLPLLFASAQMTLQQIGTLAAIYPATWGLAQLGTGALSDRVGRKWLIASGMGVQAAGLMVFAASQSFVTFAWGGVLLGLGTAMVYPTLLATVGDVAAASWRSSAIGVYRLWRDLGYVVGALIAGVAADIIGLRGAIWIVAALTGLSGVLVAARLRETLKSRTDSNDHTSKRTHRMALACPVDLDTRKLRDEIQAIYARVASEPSGTFHFHRGPDYAAGWLGYDRDALAKLPTEATASFAGVANPHRIAPIASGATVLDIGCGTGTDLLLAATSVGPAGHAIGVDMTEAMADRALQSARTAGLDNVEVRIGDAMALPAVSNTIDVVISNGVLNLTSDKRRAYGEAHRVLKPGGEFLYGDIVVAGELPESVRRNVDLWTG